MKQLTLTFIITVISFGLINCTSKKENKTSILPEKNLKQNSTNIFSSEGYKLMQQKCFICHFEKPDPSKRSSMIAPPMLRVQQHYKPTYPDKKEFVQKITEWILNPSKDKTLMPGAVRKFDVMPKLGYNKNEIEIIAETLFDIDFGQAHGMGMQHGMLKLNGNKKWKLNKNTLDLVNSISKQLENFRSDNVDKYNQLGKNVFDKAKTILLDTSYTKETFDQLHAFFNNIEEPMHLLMSAQNINEAKKQQLILINKFNKFDYYFE